MDRLLSDQALKVKRALLVRRLQQIRFEQAVQMDHHIFHLGIIHRALRCGAPGLFCRAAARCLSA